ncbi:MAG: hypothetical protein EON92_06070 [Burkholderiales bacterium]|nr:MAG: hypothetical protein EON92_06070 [Burkholderiales bacterium]
MHYFDLLWLILLGGAGAAAVFFAVGLRRRQPLLQRPPRDSSLPPISSDDAQRIFAQARSAAMERARGHGDPRNPYPTGTRAHILWETEFCTVLMDLTH